MRAQLRIGFFVLGAVVTAMGLVTLVTHAQKSGQPQDPPSKTESETEVVRVETNLVNTLVKIEILNPKLRKQRPQLPYRVGYYVRKH